MSHDEEAHDRSLLLAELRHDAPVDAEVLARIRQRVSFTLTQEHLAALGSPQRASARPAARRRAAVWGGLAAALMVGTALGAGGHAWVSSYWGPQRQLVTPPLRRAKPPGPAPRTASAPNVPQIASAPPLRSAEPSAELPRPKARVASQSVPAPSTDRGIAAELAQLERARRALAGGNASAALGVLEQERALHPTGMLAQEREALTVKALVRAGRYDEARAAGEGFVARYPNSALTGAVQRALAAIP